MLYVKRQAGEVPALYRSDCETFGADVSNSHSAWEERELAEERPCWEVCGVCRSQRGQGRESVTRAFSPAPYSVILSSEA